MHWSSEMQRLASSLHVNPAASKACIGLLGCCLIYDAQLFQVLQDALGQVVLQVGGLSEQALPLLADQGSLPLLLCLLPLLSFLLSCLNKQ